MVQLPINRDAEETSSPSSPSASPAHEGDSAWSPTKIRRIANAGLPRLPLPRKVRDLPTPEAVEIAHIVQMHAHSCLLSGKYGDPDASRVRCCTKRPSSTVEILERITLKPDVAVVELDMSWEDRRKVGQFVASLYAIHTKISCHQAREILKRAWNEASSAVKSNACLLMRQTEHLPPAPLEDGTRKPSSHECYGCILTWQTRWGRGGDVLDEFVSRGLRMDDLTELCRTLAPLKDAFDEFVTWIAEEVVPALRMTYWSCAMELNSTESSVARVHLHTFVCKNWSFWGSPNFTKAVITPVKLVYNHMVPHPQPTRLGNRQNPQRALMGGLYYQLAPKIGSLFTASNMKPWKARPRWAFEVKRGQWRRRVAKSQMQCGDTRRRAVVRTRCPTRRAIPVHLEAGPQPPPASLGGKNGAAWEGWVLWLVTGAWMVGGGLDVPVQDDENVPEPSARKWRNGFVRNAWRRGVGRVDFGGRRLALR